MTPASKDLIRAIALRLPRTRPPTSDEARAAFLAVAHDGICPACRAPDPRVHGRQRVFCPTCCTTTSLTARTPWHGVHVDVALRVLAIWHVHVDPETMTADGFARRHRLASSTAWRLFRDARSALVHACVQTSSARTQVLGRTSARNTAHVAIGLDEGELTASLAEDAPPVPDRPAPLAAWWLGRLRAWIVDVFRGVTRRYLELYLAEFAARWRRVARVDLGFP